MKFLVIKKHSVRVLILAIICASLLTINFGGGTYASLYFNDVPRLIPIYCVKTEKKQVAITFDSAWGADKTTKIVEILNEYNAKGTFFLVGFWAEDYPEMVAMLKENSIEIGTHSNTHPDFNNLSENQMKLELETSINTIKEITNDEIKIFRAPYGSYNNTLLNLTDSMGIKTIQWDVDTLDWKGISGIEICERVMSKVKNGSIILCHNNSDHILDALPLMLERLTNAGYEMVKVSELISFDNYTIDHTGMQIPN